MEKPDLTSSQSLWHTEYYSHQRPHCFASVRMFSSRNYSMEVSYSGERLKNYHMVDGCNFIVRTGEVQKDVFTLWVGHGLAWQQAGYEYTVVPGVEADAVDQYRDSTPIEILTSISKVQAVKAGRLGQIVFYEREATVIADGFSVSSETPAGGYLQRFRRIK